MTNKIKKLNKRAVLANINGLSLGDRAYCGPYGTITCVRAATSMVATAKGVVPHCKRGARRFKVTNSTKLANGGNYSMKALRKAICA